MSGSEVKVTFRVTLQDESCGRSLFIVGDCPELGHWKPKSAKPLQLASKSLNSEVWVGSYNIAADSVLYRFFLGSVQEIMKKDVILVHSWETMPHPHQLRGVKTGMDDIHITYGRLNGSVFIGRGWLMGQTAIRLSLHNNALRFRSSLSPADRYFVKCLPIDMRASSGGGIDVPDTNDNHSYARGSTIATEMFVSVLEDKRALPRLLQSEGVEYKPGDLVTFRVETWSPEHLAFKIIVSAEQNDDKAPSNRKCVKEIGVAFVDPLDLTGSKKFVATSILSRDGEIVGHLKIDVLVTKSLEYECDMSACISRYQKPDPDRAWFIGHRGMGCTIIDGVQSTGEGKKENTISSLMQAVSLGADFVEFDVMLSKDRIPVLHHDFVTSISARGKLNGMERQILIPVQHLNAKELESLETPAVTGSTLLENICSKDLEHRLEDQPFPMLKSCLQKVDPLAGFNVEVKYCMRLRSGELEEGMIHFPCRNDYVDDILCELLYHCGDRRVILSSFDPDVCAMLREKQNRHPVLFLTQGETKKYPQYEDSRTWDVETAIQFAVAESLQGVCIHAESLLKDPMLIEKGKKSGLWVISWGDDNNCQENVKFLMEKGVDGVIVDGIDKFLVC